MVEYPTTEAKRKTLVVERNLQEARFILPKRDIAAIVQKVCIVSKNAFPLIFYRETIVILTIRARIIFTVQLNCVSFSFGILHGVSVQRIDFVFGIIERDSIAILN